VEASPRTSSQSQSRADALRASPAMFDSPWLDRLSRVHPVVPAVLFGPAITAFLWLSFRQTSVFNTLALGAAGYLLWTLFEYWLHRLVFHFEPVDGLGARCTGSSTASITTTPTIRCASSCRQLSASRSPWSSR